MCRPGFMKCNLCRAQYSKRCQTHHRGQLPAEVAAGQFGPSCWQSYVIHDREKPVKTGKMFWGWCYRLLKREKSWLAEIHCQNNGNLGITLRQGGEISTRYMELGRGTAIEIERGNDGQPRILNPGCHFCER